MICVVDCLREVNKVMIEDHLVVCDALGEHAIAFAAAVRALMRFWSVTTACYVIQAGMECLHPCRLFLGPRLTLHRVRNSLTRLLRVLRFFETHYRVHVDLLVVIVHAVVHRTVRIRTQRRFHDGIATHTLHAARVDVIHRLSAQRRTTCTNTRIITT